MGRVDITQIKY